MPTRVEVAQFGGLTPALDRKQVAEPSVVDGKNFTFTAEGPKNAFAADYFSYQSIGPAKLIQSFEIADKFFYFSTDAVYSFDDVNDIWVPEFVFGASYTELFPWSRALVGGVYYFIKAGSPLLSFNPNTQTWTSVDAGTNNIPSGAVQVTQSGGRLIILGSASVAYSAIDDGTDLLPDPGTGAGFQSLGIVGGGEPLGVREVSDGFITYTTEGTLHSQVVDSIVPFRHLPLSQNIFPINPWCIVDIEKRRHIVLTDTNFWNVRNRQPELWQPLMAEYFRETLFKRYNPALNAIYALFYIPEDEEFFVSFSTSERPLEFNDSYVLKIQLDKWGFFNRHHHQILRLQSLSVSAGKNTSGFTTNIQEIGYVKVFLDLPRHEIFIPAAGQIQVRSAVQFPSFQQPAPAANQFAFNFEILNNLAGQTTGLSQGLYVWQPISHISLPTSFFIPVNNIPEWWFSDDTGWTDPEDPGFDIPTPPDFPITFSLSHGFQTQALALYEKQYIQPDSLIDIGLFRLVDEETIDRLNYLTEAKLSMVESGGSESDTFVDWNDPPPGINDVFTDYNVPAPSASGIVLETDTVADWGSGVVTGVEYTATGLGTIDGYSVYFNETEDLTLEQSSGRTRFYSTTITAMWHVLRIQTVDVNDNYHLKTMGVELNLGGRLN